MTRVNLTGLAGVTAAALLAAMVWASPARAGVIVVDFEDLEAGTVFDEGDGFERSGVEFFVRPGVGRGRSRIAIVSSEAIGNVLLIVRHVTIELPPQSLELAFRFSAGTRIRVGPKSSVPLDSILDGESITIGDLIVGAVSDPHGPFVGYASIGATSREIDSIDVGTFTSARGMSASTFGDLRVTVIPEPGTVSLGIGLAMLLIGRRSGGLPRGSTCGLAPPAR